METPKPQVPQTIIPKSLLKKNERLYACKTTKKQRRKKIMAFADAITRVEGKGRFCLGANYCCFDCMYRLTKELIENKPICVVCTNGRYFARKVK